MANTSIRNSISCLNMFERAVQDPCSHGCDNEDDSGFSNMWRQSLSDPAGVTNANNNNNSVNDGELDELDPLNEIELSSEDIRPSTRNDNDNNDNDNEEQEDEKEEEEPLVWTNPFSNGAATSKEKQRQLLSKRRRSTINNGLSMRRTRTNSSCYIQQQSRRPLRSSMVEQSPAGQQQRNSNTTTNNNNMTCNRSFSNGFPITSTSNTPYSSLSATTSSGNINNMNNMNSDTCWVHPKTLSHSSCSSILTHLYGLEKYISSDLDALAFEDVSSSTPTTTATEGFINNNLPKNNVMMQTDDRSRSDLNLNRLPEVTTTTTDFPNVTKRQKSFIEQSLANSFS
ncbi:similar to Saccharomyces cerevisiae YMR081C ISF1 Serine-rich, hydrophilic protein with similarity to Mbr1p [Maudiozyma barnettii]|uniref:Similar to Saccharomyces cerevisiae YMR081C ISF1 Serine-rich, hydrophilic protein with similarity to Mbr1p n=1 Tax=Maudiozyma barnettii TaxID=61262 RepID=A0A8H2VKR9_9SACH|nr:uncharacterized protein KABA2_13S04268 [Kazachstania barnettii]CAB4257158.1 similar to Saccharomyces cerevisiae YMR081C ISF1 Serine-rich, hydrophilic protein with similarity to Mbr1p [Kazachstania barnettii]CAD1779528.1 similar to Saccharomyces cerevisiae YMR081C ISF1 Serine-rich, hydrophilic protein with similarity to Mbr1p [Kazachstania barnettii]